MSEKTVDLGLLTGQVLNKKYHVQEWLGSGPNGTVYRAIHLGTMRTVAVKVLKPEIVGNQPRVESFLREAKTAMRIEHPSVIKVTDFDVADNNLFYLVMEVAEGIALSELLKAGAIDTHRAVNLIVQLCEVLDAVHKQHILHRDLKPKNIIVQQRGGQEIVKVLDFGIASSQLNLEPQRTKSGVLIGTPQYMAPELFLGDRATEATDIYSLGVIAYEMLTGQLPLTPPTSTENLRGWAKFVSQEQPAPMHVIAPHVRTNITTTIMCALEKDPAKRLHSARVFAEKLRQAEKEPEAIGQAPIQLRTAAQFGAKQKVPALPRSILPTAIGGALLGATFGTIGSVIGAAFGAYLGWTVAHIATEKN